MYEIGFTIIKIHSTLIKIAQEVSMTYPTKQRLLPLVLAAKLAAGGCKLT